MKKLLFILLLGISITGFYSCQGDDDDDTVKKPTPYELKDIPMFPTEYNIPEDNPLTVEGIRLGRYLYYDGRLSGRTECDSQMSCATCHIQKNGFEVGPNHDKYINGRPFGLTGVYTPHVMLSHENLVYNFSGLAWNGGVPSLEEMVKIVILLPEEINGSWEKTVKMIESIPMYPPMFEAAFGTPEVTIDRIAKAIAQFIRTIRSYNSKYHKWLRHEPGVQMTAQELKGMELFMSEKADCFHCHGTILFTTNLFYNNAKDTCTEWPCNGDPYDRYSVTHDPMMIGAYKAPSLINCELKAPYMHDGRFKTLREVVDFYADKLNYNPYVDPLMKYVNYGGNQLTEEERESLVAFLKTLTDWDLINNPDYSKPADLDTGCP